MKKHHFLLFSLILLTQLAFSQSTLYVSSNGNDNALGTEEQPFFSIEKALERVVGKNTTIIIQAGEYYITNTLQITSQHEGLRMIGKEDVMVSGGKVIDVTQVQNIRPNIYAIDLKKEGISNFGSIQQMGSQPSFKLAPLELFINDEAGRLAIFPNDTNLLIVDLIPDALLADSLVKFRYDLNVPAWKNTENIWIEGYFSNGYFKDALPVHDINVQEKTIICPLPNRYGITSQQDHNRFHFFNVKEAIDEEGEYYIDRQEGVLYFYTTKNIEKIEVSLLEKPLIQIQNTADIHLENITFQAGRSMGLVLTDSKNCRIHRCIFRNVGATGIWIGKYFYQKKNEKIVDVIGKDTSLYTLEKYIDSSQNNTISNCLVYNTGAGGIRLHGGNRYSLEKGNNRVTNTIIHHFNRINKNYKAGVRIEGVGNTIQHCHISRGSNQAILLSGNEHLIEYNDIHDVCLEVDDGGALYYGRNPSERGHIVRHNYFHHIGKNPKYETAAIYHDDGACGMEVYGNIFLQAGKKAVIIGGGQDNYYHNNLFVSQQEGIHIDDRLGNWAKHHMSPNAKIPRELQCIQYQNPPYISRYPHLANYWKNKPHIPQRNVFENNLFVDVEIMFPMGNKFLEFKNSNVMALGFPSIWNTKIHDRNFIPNEMYLPRPSQWKTLKTTQIGVSKEVKQWWKKM